MADPPVLRFEHGPRAARRKRLQPPALPQAFPTRCFSWTFLVSLPLKLCERGSRVASVIFVEKAPLILLGLRRCSSLRNRRTLRHQPANVFCEPAEIALVVFERLGQIPDDGAMPWNHLRGLYVCEAVQCCKPPPDAAVHDWDVLEHEKVARKKNAGGAIEDRQIIVRMRRRPSLQGKEAF